VSRSVNNGFDIRRQRESDNKKLHKVPAKPLRPKPIFTKPNIILILRKEDDERRTNVKNIASVGLAEIMRFKSSKSKVA
jgi:hypothetical protein